MKRRELMAAGAGALAGLALGAGGQDGEAAEGKTLQERLGYEAMDRLLIIHADDIGMSHTVNAASIRALTEGSVTCGSVMVPCPWLMEILQWSKEHPEADLGLHLTLTSEWIRLRWGPVTPWDRVPGLLDEQGYMWRHPNETAAHASAAEVATEIRAQIRRARKLGMNPTHVDTHMGTVFARPDYTEAYVRVAREENLVPMLPRPRPAGQEEARGVGTGRRERMAALEAQGYPLIDNLNSTLTQRSYEDRKKELMDWVRGLKPGVNQLICHLSSDDEEIRRISNAWQRRVTEGKMFCDPEVKQFLADQGVKMIGYRKLNELFNKAGAGH